MRKKPLIQNKLPSVSVIIPTYNNGRFIKSALESLLRQNYPEELVEIIVIDDGSTDNTNEILRGYKEKIAYVYKENKGVASARNLGISLSKNEIITFLDSDDIWHEERLLRVVEKFDERQDIGIVYHPFSVIDSNGTTIHDNFYKLFGYTEHLGGWITNDIFSGRIFCGGSSFASKKEIIQKVYPIPEDIKRGIDFYMTALSSCYASAEYIPDILSKYRLHNDNITMSAGHSDYKELALVNRDFAFMRQKVIKNLMRLNSADIKAIDINILKRLQAKETIFYNVLSRKRLRGIRYIPALFKGKLSIQDFLKGIVVSFVTLFIPSFLFPKLLKAYELLRRLKIIRF